MIVLCVVIVDYLKVLSNFTLPSVGSRNRSLMFLAGYHIGQLNTRFNFVS